jgi:hypothetical protein
MKRLVAQREKALARILENGNFVRGSITSVCSKCNRANCICATKSSGKAYRLNYKDALQKTKIVYVPKSRLPEIRKLLANHRLLRKLIDQLMALNVEIFKKSTDPWSKSCG